MLWMKYLNLFHVVLSDAELLSCVTVESHDVPLVRVHYGSTVANTYLILNFIKKLHRISSDCIIRINFGQFPLILEHTIASDIYPITGQYNRYYCHAG